MNTTIYITFFKALNAGKCILQQGRKNNTSQHPGIGCTNRVYTHPLLSFTVLGLMSLSCTEIEDIIICLLLILLSRNHLFYVPFPLLSVLLLHEVLSVTTIGDLVHCPIILPS